MSDGTKIEWTIGGVETACEGGSLTEIEPCPKCGALPCDWTDNPHTTPSGDVERVARAIELCDVCDGEGTVCDGMDEAGCSMPCPVCFGTGYDVTAAYAAMREAMEPVNRKKFPILGAPGATIDWQLVHDHGRQAKANHYQTVERLAERGGLSWCELHAILHNRPWQKMEENTAIMECRALEARYLSSILPEIKP